MFSQNSSYSYSGNTTLKKFQNYHNLNSTDKIIKENYNLDSNFDINNNILSSYKQNYRQHIHYLPKRNRFTTSSAFSHDIKANINIKPATNQNYNFNNEDIKKIYESIEDIKMNQKEIISAIKELNPNKAINNTINQAKKEDIKEDNKNDLLTTINKLKEDYDKLRNEMLILKEKDDENKKIIELNRKEIDNFKKKLNESENKEDISDKLNYLEINKLKEALKKNENEKNDLKNLNDKKDNEIKDLKSQIDDYKSKISLSEAINDLNKNVDFIKNSLFNLKENQNQTKEQLKISQTADFEPLSQIINKDGLFTAENKKA